MSKIIALDAKSYPCTGGAGPTMIMLTVLVERIEGTFKAYAAIVPDNSIEDPNYEGVRDWVKRNGAPIKAEAAELLFSGLKGKYAA